MSIRTWYVIISTVNLIRSQYVVSLVFIFVLNIHLGATEGGWGGGMDWEVLGIGVHDMKLPKIQRNCVKHKKIIKSVCLWMCVKVSQGKFN